MKTRLLLGLGAVALLAVATAFAAEGVKLAGVKCVVAGSKDAQAAQALEYKGGQVYFCCGNCVKAFSGDVAKFAARANHQLVATGQARQVACPFSGQAADSSTKVKIAGVEVAFCCDMCKAQAEESKEAVNLVFADKPFEKGFKVGK